jgi:DNA polymerase-1
VGHQARITTDDIRNARGELSRIMKNMPIQGTSADMTKLAMLRIHERLTPPRLDGGTADAGLVNTVHDELVGRMPARRRPRRL